MALLARNRLPQTGGVQLPGEPGGGGRRRPAGPENEKEEGDYSEAGPEPVQTLLIEQPKAFVTVLATGLPARRESSALRKSGDVTPAGSS